MADESFGLLVIVKWESGRPAPESVNACAEDIARAHTLNAVPLFVLMKVSNIFHHVSLLSRAAKRNIKAGADGVLL
jgi:hypothetical protein